MSFPLCLPSHAPGISCLHMFSFCLFLLYGCSYHFGHALSSREHYLTSIVSGAKPNAIRAPFALALWLPWSSMLPSFAVPPHANFILSFFAMSLSPIRSEEHTSELQ